MTTAIDTDILIDVLIPSEAIYDSSAAVEPLTWSALSHRGPGAGHQATRRLSRDRGFYRELFPPLTVIDPSTTLEHP